MGCRQPNANEGFIRGYRAGLAWTLEPANREAGTALLLKNMPEIHPQVDSVVVGDSCRHDAARRPQGALLPAGVTTVLELRSRCGQR